MKATEPNEANGGWSVRAHLIALALASTLPIGILAGFLAYHIVFDSLQKVRVDFEQRLQLLRNGVELRIANVIEDLEILARSPDLQRGDFANWRQHALQTLDLTGAYTLVVTDTDGRELVDTAIPLGTPLPRRTVDETMNRVVQTGQPQVSDLRDLVQPSAPAGGARRRRGLARRSRRGGGAGHRAMSARALTNEEIVAAAYRTVGRRHRQGLKPRPSLYDGHPR